MHVDALYWTARAGKEGEQRKTDYTYCSESQLHLHRLSIDSNLGAVV